MAPLHAVLAQRREEVLHRWRSNVEGTITPESMPTVELLDHIPLFLDEVISALRSDAGDHDTAADETQTASDHGEQRLRLGFSLDAVVREYGALRDAMIETGRSAGGTITFREAQVVFDLTITGIADAVSEYARQRDAELLRQHNEHVAFLAHELRNPLASAVMAVALLDARGALPPDEKAAVALRRSLDKLSELVDHTLNMARVVARFEVRPQREQLSRLLKDVETLVTFDAEGRGIDLVVSMEQDVQLMMDIRLMHSALSNLVRNAIKYSHDGGTVELRSRVQSDRLILEVEDGCGGLPPGMVEQAFAPFVRLTGKQQGFGLGLAIAKQAVDAHEGLLRVQNLPGKGCIFVMELPLPNAPK